MFDNLTDYDAATLLTKYFSFACVIAGRPTTVVVLTYIKKAFQNRWREFYKQIIEKNSFGYDWDQKQSEDDSPKDSANIMTTTNKKLVDNVNLTLTYNSKANTE